MPQTPPPAPSPEGAHPSPDGAPAAVAPPLPEAAVASRAARREAEAKAATPPPDRALAPDLARGLMLLLIATANVSWHLWGHPTGLTSAHPTDGGPLDTALATASLVLVDGRVYPLFAFLFGYGMVQFSVSRAARGVPTTAVRRMLRRRHWWMIAFGALHALLLFNGDILGAYGLAGLVVGGIFFARTDRTLRIVSWIMGCLLALGALLSLVSGLLLTRLPAEVRVEIAEATAASAEGAGSPLTDMTAGQPNYLLAALARIGMWALSTPGALLMLAVPLALMLGWLSARHRLLEDPAAHRGRLVRIAWTGIGIGVLGGLPQALAFAGVLSLPAVAPWMLAGLHSVSGVAGGLGYAALFALLALRLGRRPAQEHPVLIARPVRAIAAVGKRSLSFYLFQSLVFAPVLTAWGLGLGDQIGTAGAFALAAAVWLLSCVIAATLEDRGARGPAEVLLRRLTYGRDGG
ncbi:DUF418 domain-containing protein [Brevibacterium album]|uniref:DUF418 domain-containing protein n=1 Tax=Brevibacterium album TaxID=417948 RepID=UPI00040F7CE4|nr:DUF418 domain-containing protein [Brevibacterium album]